MRDTMSFIPQVLIVDDNDSICQSLKLILDRKGYNTTTAKTGKGALILAQTIEFQIALLDIQLPDMTGLDILSKFTDHYPQISVVVITGHASKETAIKAIEKGAVAYLEKPLDIEALLQTLTHISEKKKIQYEKQQKEHEAALIASKSEMHISSLRYDIKNELQILEDHLASALKLLEGENSEIKELLESGLAATKKIGSLCNSFDSSRQT